MNRERSALNVGCSECKQWAFAVPNTEAAWPLAPDGVTTEADGFAYELYKCALCPARFAKVVEPGVKYGHWASFKG